MGDPWAIHGQNVGVTLGERPRFEDVRADLDEVLRYGAGNLRGKDLPALRAIAVYVGRSSPEETEPAPIVGLLREVVGNHLSHRDDGPAAMYALGLARNYGTATKGIRLKRAAEVKKRHYDTFRKEPVQRLMDQVAEALIAVQYDADSTPGPAARAPAQAGVDLAPRHIVAPRARPAVPLPPPRVRSLQWSEHAYPEGTTIIEVIEHWYADTDSNLLYVCGPLGSGKSARLQAWAATLPPDQALMPVSMLEVDPRQRLDRVNSPVTVAIEDFDSLSSRSEWGAIRPDLSWLRNAFAAGARCIVLTRRNPDSDADELSAQLRNSGRLRDLGVQEPHVVRVEPMAVAELKAFATSLGDARLHELAEAIEADGRISPLLMTPMVLDQLYQSYDDGHDDEQGIIPRTEYQSYRRYIEFVCGSDYDRGVSRIPGRVRYQIYGALAWHIFRGVEGRNRPTADILDIGVELVAKIVAEQVATDANLRMSRDFREYAWATDLIATGQIFGLRREDERVAGFTHKGYYEYFVAEAARLRLSGGVPLELDEARLVQFTRDAPILTFLRVDLSARDLDAVAQFVEQDRLSWMDRLVGLYLLEEHPSFLSLLRSSSAEYWQHAHAVADDARSLYLSKILSYQEVVCGRADAAAYLDLIRTDEQAADLALERQMLRSHIGVNDSLIARLQNPGAAAARPITLYRLGQLGSPSAIPAIERVAESDPALRGAADAAIARIRRRQ